MKFLQELLVHFGAPKKNLSRTTKENERTRNKKKTY